MKGRSRKLNSGSVDNLLRMVYVGSRDAAYDHARRNFDRLAMDKDRSSRNDFMGIKEAIEELEGRKSSSRSMQSIAV